MSDETVRVLTKMVAQVTEDLASIKIQLNELQHKLHKHEAFALKLNVIIGAVCTAAGYALAYYDVLAMLFK